VHPWADGLPPEPAAPGRRRMGRAQRLLRRRAAAARPWPGRLGEPSRPRLVHPDPLAVRPGGAEGWL